MDTSIDDLPLTTEDFCYSNDINLLSSNRDDEDILLDAAFESFFFGDTTMTTTDADDVNGMADAIVSDHLFSMEEETEAIVVRPGPVPDEILSRAPAENSMDRIRSQLAVLSQALAPLRDITGDRSITGLNRFKRKIHLRGMSKIDAPLLLSNDNNQCQYDNHDDDVRTVCQKLIPKSMKDLEVLQGAASVIIRQQQQQVMNQQLHNNVRRSSRATVPSIKAQASSNSIATASASTRRSTAAVTNIGGAAVPDVVSSTSAILSSGTCNVNSNKAISMVKPCTSSKPMNSTTTNASRNTSLPQIYTAKQQQVELPTGTDAESKRQRRLIRNRLSAALHRERKREVIDTLQKQVEDRDEKLRLLATRVSQLEKDRTDLTCKLALLSDHFGAQKINGILNDLNCKEDSPTLVSREENETTELDDASSLSSCSSNTTSLSNQEQNQANRGSNKRRRKNINTNPAGMLVLASTMAVALCCACIGQINLGSNSMVDLDTYPSPSSIPDQRRRLSSTTVTSSSKSAEFVLSPLEVHPHLWNTNTKQGPWTGTRGSQQLFITDDIDNNANIDSTTAVPSTAPSMAVSSKSNHDVMNSFMFCPDAVTNVSPQFLHVTNIQPSSRTSADTDIGTSTGTADSFTTVPTSTSTGTTSSPVQAPTPAPKLKLHLDDTGSISSITPGSNTGLFAAAPTPHHASSSSNSINDAPVTISAAPYMKLLLPASAFFHNQDENDDANNTTSADQSWIELGCEIKDARVLDGVDFIMSMTS